MEDGYDAWLQGQILLEELVTDTLLQALKNFLKYCNNLNYGARASPR
jgi:hypothetical protein